MQRDFCYSSKISQKLSKIYSLTWFLITDIFCWEFIRIASIVTFLITSASVGEEEWALWTICFIIGSHPITVYFTVAIMPFEAHRFTVKRWKFVNLLAVFFYCWLVSSRKHFVILQIFRRRIYYIINFFLFYNSATMLLKWKSANYTLSIWCFVIL